MKMYLGTVAFTIIVISLQGPEPASTAHFAPPPSCYGIKNGQRIECVFPFTYKGQSYNSCTTVDSSSGASWCATSVYGPDRTVHQNGYADCLAGCN